MTQAVTIHAEDGIARVRLSRPEVLNAFDRDMAVALSEGLGPLAVDRSVRAVVLDGAGRAFCAGGNLAWVKSFPAGPGAALHQLAGLFHRSIVEIRRMDKPVVAAVNGVAAGAGFSLALACDFRVMDETAVLRQAYTAAGLSIDGGGTFTLPRLVGFARALEIAALDPKIDAETALAWGLVTRVAEAGRAEEEALALARDLTSRSLTSFAASKRLLSDGFDRPLEVQLEREREAIAACAVTPDGREGIAAFTEKRKPGFGQAE
jgi:2-(1,2-epoxy-1,2-dihydrophenyl)acetyl-CoA isomerase